MFMAATVSIVAFGFNWWTVTHEMWTRMRFLELR